MSEISSKFDSTDINTLIEAMDDWEVIGNHEFHVLSMIKDAPMPPEDHEAFEMFSQIKQHFKNREKDIVASRMIRQEKAILLKAKLMLARRDLSINQLFEMASTPISIPITPVIYESTSVPVIVAPSEPIAAKVNEQLDAAKLLDKAEFFIRDLGVWDHYQKFLADSNK